MIFRRGVSEGSPAFFFGIYLGLGASASTAEVLNPDDMVVGQLPQFRGRKHI